MRPVMSAVQGTRALTGSLAVVTAAVAVTCALPASAATSPGASPGASTTATDSPSPSATPSASVSPSATPTTTSTPTPTATATPTVKPTPKPTTKPKPKIVWVNKHTISVGGQYLINPDGFRESMTVENLGYGNNFTVSTKTPAKGKVLAFPDFLYGCSWGVCSPHRKLPVQISRDGNPGASVSTSGHPAGEYNAAYDIWLEWGPYLTGQPHGAEIMIWPRETSNVGSLRGRPEVRIDGALYWEIEWRARNSHGSWNYVQFRKVSQTNSLNGIHLNDFFRAAQARGWASPNWYIQSITAGFEIWSGGQGLKMYNFWARS
jgi:Glycosyl hydrolase family 12